AVINGADIVRVHDVKETRRCVDLVDQVVRS
ncbi:MAG: dihydropteroate synthase, partial [Thermoplasmata archaeon]